MEVAGRAEATVKEMLNVAHAGGTSTVELRDVLAVTKRIAAVVATVQTHLASAVAVTERHGDGGTEVLAETTGLTRREARGQVKTAKTIAGVPSVRDAVAQGRVSLANAKRLADAVERTSAGAVEADGGLLKMAESLRAEQFTKEARRWIAEQQDDGGEADHQRMRAKRCVRVWDNDNGMVELHGTFDPLTGKRIGNRLRAEANRLYQHDKKHATLQDQHERGNQQQGETNGQRHKDASSSGRDSTPDSGGSGGSKRGRAPGNPKAGDRRRSFDQCMADALDNLTSNTITAPSRTDSGSAAPTGTTTSTGTAETTNPSKAPCVNTRSVDAGTVFGGGDVGETGAGSAAGSGAEVVISNGQRGCPTVRSAEAGAVFGNGGGGGIGNGSGSSSCAECGAETGASRNTDSPAGLGRAFADICVIVQVDAATGELVAQLPDGERLPASVLDKLTCNARVSVILSTARGQPIWRAIAARAASDTQRRLLLARWGGCFHCGAHPAMCQIHHIVPVAHGGETKIDNLIPVCWDCHDLIHHNHWQIHKHPKGNHTLHPPQQHYHGPAHAPEQPLLFTSADDNSAQHDSSPAHHDHGSAADSDHDPARHDPAHHDHEDLGLAP